MNKEVKDQFSFEKKCQPKIDEIYRIFTYIENINRSNNCKKYDVILTTIEGQDIKIEEKFRRHNARVYDDFLFEIIQSVFPDTRKESKEKLDLGWYYYCEADQVNVCYLNKDENIDKIYSVKWNDFKNWFEENYKSLSKKINVSISTNGYGLTINCAIKWKYIPIELYEVISEYNREQEKN